MRASRLALIGLLIAGALPTIAGAQALVRLRGVAFDSVAKVPLADALVTLDGARSTTSDSIGGFAFDSVAPGDHLWEMQHAVLDSMGLSGVVARVRVGTDEPALTIAIPSFSTLWHAACGARPAPADSGIVYGSIRDARNGDPVGDARVLLTWTDLSLVNMQRYSQKAYRNETRADGGGEYGFCGVPMGNGLRLQATVAGGASGSIDMGLTKLRILRRDLTIGPTDTSAAIPRGYIEGTILNEQGAPVAGATIVLDDVPQLRTGDDGRFRLINVLPGTRQLEVLAIGVRPQLLVADVIAGRSASVSATMQKVTALAEVKVMGSRWQQRMIEEFDTRKKMKLGQRIDSTLIERRVMLSAAVTALPSVSIRVWGGGFAMTLPGPGGGRCAPNHFIDGIRVESEVFTKFDPRHIALIEAFPRRSQVPPTLWVLNNCGAVAIWTKQMLP